MRPEDRIASFLQSPCARNPTTFNQLRSFVKGDVEYHIGECALIKASAGQPWVAFVTGKIVAEFHCFLILFFICHNQRRFVL